MIPIEGPSTTQLASRPQGDIAKPAHPMTVGALEQALLSRFPVSDAEEWDRMGLLVGDPAQQVTGVACALDVTVRAVRQAREAGANVLLTHHPAFLEAPRVLSPSHVVAPASGVAAFEAARLGVALMNFHTALDVSDEGAHMLPGLLGLDFERIAVPCAPQGKGYGQVCSVRAGDRPLSLGQLAARCLSVFGRPARVWGDFEMRLDTVVTATGSAGQVVDACLRQGADCLVAGEVKYHAALDAVQAGLAIVELGHDVSELPFAAVLAAAAAQAGVPSDLVTILDQSGNWRCPESTRI